MKTQKPNEIDHDLREFFATEEPSQDYVDRQRLILKTYLLHENESTQKQAPGWSFPKLVFGLAMLGLVMLLAGGPGRVWASVMNLIHYVPNYGFVTDENPLILDSASIITNPEGNVSIRSAVATSQETRLELHFSEGAQPPSQTWLENGQGERLELKRWEYKPDTPGSKGLMLFFAPISGGEARWTLHFSLEVSLGLVWRPALESDALPNQLATGRQDYQQPCILASTVPICLQAASIEGDNVRFLLGLKPTSDGETRAVLPQPEDPMGSKENPLSQLKVEDDQGVVVTLNLTNLEFDPKMDLLTYEGKLPGNFDKNREFYLTLDGVLVREAVDKQVEIDLGENPQPNQEFEINQTIEIAGSKITFDQAVTAGTRLVISSDQVDTAQPRQIRSLTINKPVGIDNLYGSGYRSDTRQFTINVELEQTSGMVSGMLVFSVVEVEVLDNTPKVLPFRLKNLPLYPTSSPNLPTASVTIVRETPRATVISSQPVEALDFEWSGEIPQAGDLMLIEPRENGSVVSFYSATDDFAHKDFLRLSASVTELRLLPDGDGVSFITGAPLNSLVHSDLWAAHRSLWTWKFGEAGMAKRSDLPEHVIESHWSHDGNRLVLRTMAALPGNIFRTELFVYDLIACAESAELCDGEKVKIEDARVETVSWHPDEPVLAVLYADQSGEGSAIALIDLNDLKNPIVEVVEKEFPILYGPLHWVENAQKLQFNLGYGLATYDLDLKTLEQLPFEAESSSRRSQIVNGRWVVLDVFDREAEKIRLLAFDFEEEKLETLLEIPFGNRTKSQLGVFGVLGSPGTDRSLVISQDQGSFFLNLSDGRRVNFGLRTLPAMEVLTDRLYWLP